jgi:8-oxo-dGTP pyrophosphatase MutT (NUDIX family)
MNTVRTVVAREISGAKRVVSANDMTFRISVYGVTINQETVLLVPQWDGYDIPGGGIELGETTEEALIREMHEETGLTVRPMMDKILHVTQDFFIHPTDGKSYHYILLYYLCSLVGGKISDANFREDEKLYAHAARWVPLEDVGSLKFYNPVDSASVIAKARRLLDAAEE